MIFWWTPYLWIEKFLFPILYISSFIMSLFRQNLTNRKLSFGEIIQFQSDIFFGMLGFFWKFLDCKREALIATKILFCDEVCDNFSVTIRNYRMSSLKSIKSEICEADAIYRVITNFWFNVKLRKINLKLWMLWTNFEFPRLVLTLKIVLGLISDVDRLLE